MKTSFKTLEDYLEARRQSVARFRMRKRIAEGKDPIPLTKQEAIKVASAAYAAQREARASERDEQKPECR
jgi:hypothetical protein